MGTGFAAPLLGLGAFFLQPYEIAGIAGRGQPVTASALLLVGLSHSLWASKRWSIEPQLAFFFPKTLQDSQLELGALANANFGYRVGRGVGLFGAGVSARSLISDGGSVERGGNFVTPGGNSLAWLLTLNAGAGYWLDEKIRLDAQGFVSRVLSNSARRYRFLFGVSYAL